MKDLRSQYKYSRYIALHWIEFWTHKLLYRSTKERDIITYYNMLMYNNRRYLRSFPGWYIHIYLKEKFEMSWIYQAYLNLRFMIKKRENS